jgi:hypothetical protein
MYLGAGGPACGNVCSSGGARCDDDLGDQYLAMRGISVAAQADAGFVKLRLVKIAGLPI